MVRVAPFLTHGVFVFGQIVVTVIPYSANTSVAIQYSPSCVNTALFCGFYSINCNHVSKPTVPLWLSLCSLIEYVYKYLTTVSQGSTLLQLQTKPFSLHVVFIKCLLNVL